MSRNNDGLPMLPPWLSESDVSQAGYEAPVENLPHDDLIPEKKSSRRLFGNRKARKDATPDEPPTPDASPRTPLPSRSPQPPAPQFSAPANGHQDSQSGTRPQSPQPGPGPQSGAPQQSPQPGQSPQSGTPLPGAPLSGTAAPHTPLPGTAPLPAQPTTRQDLLPPSPATDSGSRFSTPPAPAIPPAGPQSAAPAAAAPNLAPTTGSAPKQPSPGPRPDLPPPPTQRPDLPPPPGAEGAQPSSGSRFANPPASDAPQSAQQPSPFVPPRPSTPLPPAPPGPGPDASRPPIPDAPQRIPLAGQQPAGATVRIDAPAPAPRESAPPKPRIPDAPPQGARPGPPAHAQGPQSAPLTPPPGVPTLPPPPQHGPADPPRPLDQAGPGSTAPPTQQFPGTGVPPAFPLPGTPLDDILAPSTGPVPHVPSAAADPANLTVRVPLTPAPGATPDRRTHSGTAESTHGAEPAPNHASAPPHGATHNPLHDPSVGSITDAPAAPAANGSRTPGQPPTPRSDSALGTADAKSSDKAHTGAPATDHKPAQPNSPAPADSPAGPGQPPNSGRHRALDAPLPPHHHAKTPRPEQPATPNPVQPPATGPGQFAASDPAQPGPYGPRGAQSHGSTGPNSLPPQPAPQGSGDRWQWMSPPSQAPAAHGPAAPHGPGQHGNPVGAQPPSGPSVPVWNQVLPQQPAPGAPQQNPWQAAPGQVPPGQAPQGRYAPGTGAPGGSSLNGAAAQQAPATSPDSSSASSMRPQSDAAPIASPVPETNGAPNAPGQAVPQPNSWLQPGPGDNIHSAPTIGGGIPALSGEVRPGGGSAPADGRPGKPEFGGPGQDGHQADPADAGLGQSGNGQAAQAGWGAPEQPGPYGQGQPGAYGSGQPGTYGQPGGYGSGLPGSHGPGQPGAYTPPSGPVQYGLGGQGPSLDDVPMRRAKKSPGSGWRRAVHHVSGGAINPGLSAEERRLQELVARIRQPVRGDYRIAVLSLKGGVGKTTTTMGLGSIFSSIRGDRVIAVDANPDFGTLSQRVPLQTRSTVRDLLLDPSIERYSDVRRHTSQASSRLEVLASERDPAASEAFSEDEYRNVARILQRFYNIILTDCGTGLMHSAMAGVLDLAHSLVLISSSAIDGARSAAATLDWLSLHGHDHLVRNAVVVINLPRPGAPNVGINQLRDYFLSRCRAVHIIPYDSHLGEGAEIDLTRLQKETKRAYVELAATVADEFAVDHRRYRD
ncbi:AAA family ATPase [Nocardia sp. NPDC006630]|uniref:nucleotide-binding protein n=1 Tax=Nocardia sp. NPDC006630 TaxID=3157181 RepID=UPI0033BB7C36